MTRPGFPGYPTPSIDLGQFFAPNPVLKTGFPFKPQTPLFFASSPRPADIPVSPLVKLALAGLGGIVLMRSQMGAAAKLIIGGLGAAALYREELLDASPFAVNKPAQQSGTGAEVKYVNTGQVMSPETAYNLIKSGQYNTVLGAKMSVYYHWRDFFSSSYFNQRGNMKNSELSAMQGGARMARVLDTISSTMGSKQPVISWYRPKAYQIQLYQSRGVPINKIPLGSRHIFGDGVDFGGSWDHRKNKLFPVLRKTPAVRRIGLGDGRTPSHQVLHIDLMTDSYNKSPATQTQFIDNGPDGSHTFRTVPILGSGNV